MVRGAKKGLLAVLAALPAILALTQLSGAALAQFYSEGPTVDEYMRENPHATLIGNSGFEIDGNRMYCGRRPLIVDGKFDSWGGAYPGFLIWNPVMTAKLPTVVKLYIFSHECGHQFVGRDEKAADCFAIRRGRRYGWLNEQGMEAICSFISNLRADDEHAGGQQRCAYMKRCYVEAAEKAP